MSLRIHPWFGERVRIVRGAGADSAVVERPDGAVHIIPVSWTDLQPRVVTSTSRLDLDAVHELARWVAARRQVESLGTDSDPCDQSPSRRTDGQAAADRGGATSAPPVVGEARASRTPGRGGDQ